MTATLSSVCHCGRLISVPCPTLGDIGAAAAEIERLLIDVEHASAMSTLRVEPDRMWIDDFVATVYGDEVRQAV